MKKITIIGAGAFGFAFARLISQNNKNKEIIIYDINKNFIEHLNKTKQHPIFHGDSKLSEHVIATTNLSKALKEVNLVILAVPSKFLRTALKEIKGLIVNKPIFLSLTKGLDPVSKKAPFEIISEVLKIKRNIAVLSGGMIAREVTLDYPLAADLACRSKISMKKISELISGPTFRLNLSTDVIGVSYAGIVKNVIAIAGGILEGLGYKESTKSALISYFSKEMVSFILSQGGKKKTFSYGSQAWFGDLITTCFGDSRNREFGFKIGMGENIESVFINMKKEKKSVEGYHTTKVLYELSRKSNIKTPILNILYSILYSDANPKSILNIFKI